jgi:hypothetical protein
MLFLCPEKIHQSVFCRSQVLSIVLATASEMRTALRGSGGKVTEGSKRQAMLVAQNVPRDVLTSVHRVANLLDPDGETPCPGLAYTGAQHSEQVQRFLISPVRT